MSDTLLRTPLYDLHVAHDAKMVPFAGWEMPVQYQTGVMQEHLHCRSKAALFDVSHMGQLSLKGPAVGEQLEALCPQALATLAPNKARYSFLTNDEGGIIDDMIVTNAGDHYFVVVNAAHRDRVIEHIRSHLSPLITAEVSDNALVALQGPCAEQIVGNLCPDVSKLRFMESMFGELNGVTCRISRLGYTGEDGFGISIPADDAISLTRQLLVHEDCQLAGLGARDSLRLEAGLCLYGNDIDESTSPVEAALGWAIQKRRREEGGFPGAQRIQNDLSQGVQKKLVGIRPASRAPARAGVAIQTADGTQIGTVTSGCFGPTIKGPVAMGYIASSYTETDTEVYLSIRGKPHAANIAALPFIQPNYKR